MSWFKSNLLETNKGIEIVTFADGTDEQIAAIIDAYYNGNLTLEQIQDIWTVGDIRNIDIAAIETSGTYNNNTWSVGESHRAQTVQIQILDFDHDILTTANGSITKALMTVDLKDCLRDASVTDTTGVSNTEKGYMNSSDTNAGGWTSCARRAWCNGGFYQALPEYIRSRIKSVNKETSAGEQSSTINTTSDYCFLLSEKEIFGATTYTYAEGTPYSLYSKVSTNKYKMPGWISEYPDSSAWWERSPYSNASIAFCMVNSSGKANAQYANYSAGLAPAFCL